MSDHGFLSAMLCAFKGEAARWFRMEREHMRSWKKFAKMFKDRYVGEYDQQDSARRINIRIQFCKITTFWVICLNNLLLTIVIDKRKNTGTFIFGYAKDGAVRFSISLPDFAWYLAWSMSSTQSTIVYPYFTLTN